MSFTEKLVDNVTFMTASNINTTHAFTTRIGGVSDGIYESLNLAQMAGDDIENVKKNYTLLCNALDISIDDIIRSNQIHGTHVHVVTENDRCKLFTPSPHSADSIIANIPGAALMVYIADCVPILLYDPVKKAVGAVHAGWRSTVADISGVTIDKMVKEFGCSPGNIKAAIGPCISKCCFETDSDVADALTEALGNNACGCMTKHGNKYFVDLKEANNIMLKKAGLIDILISDECTSCLADKYWSHRRTKGQRGSQAALIIISDLKGNVL